MPRHLLKITEKSRNLSDILADAGFSLDLRCGGHGSCGRCSVWLASGEWNVAGKILQAPHEALACHTRLVSSEGSVEIPEQSLLKTAICGTALESWNVVVEIPDIQSAVVGFDIGTTTLAATAYKNGRCLSSASCYNPQAAYGDNVMARISASDEHLDDMRRCLLDAMRCLLKKMSLSEPPARIAIAGNSTMTCIFHGISPKSLGNHPFTLPVNSFPVVSAKCLGLADDVEVYTVPPATAFIGGDVIGGLGGVSLKPGEAFIDLGTNCEIVLCLPDGSYCGTAAAAGPAFEGAGIGCGSRAVPGAVCSFQSPDDFKVIGDGKASGVCGSALVDVLAYLKRSGRLSSFGRFQPSADTYEIMPGIILSESDIARLLVAKAAVAAGFQTLEKHCGIAVTRIVLAGGFAQYLNMDNARTIGLLPCVPTVAVGNTSLAGAVRMACYPEWRYELANMSVREFLLNNAPDFENAFIDAMRL